MKEKSLCILSFLTKSRLPFFPPHPQTIKTPKLKTEDECITVNYELEHQQSHFRNSLSITSDN